MRAIIDLNNRLSALERRLAGSMRHGPVEEVNIEEGWVRLNLGEGDSGPLLSPKIPYAQVAGALKVHSPPSVGQQMTVFSPTGDMRQGVAMPLTWSDNEKDPHDGANPVITYGSVKVEIQDDAAVVTTSGATISISGGDVTVTADGPVTVNSSEVRLGGGGGERVARLGDHVNVTYGSSAGLHPIVEAAEKVWAE